MSTTHFSGPIALGSGSVQTLAAAKTLTGDDNGKTFFLNLAGGFTVTLPAVSNAGFRVKFIVKTAPTTAYIVASAAGDDILGGFDTGEDAAGSVDSEVSGGADQVNFVANTSVIGDYAEFVSDGTNWYVGGHCNVQDGMTLTG